MVNILAGKISKEEGSVGRISNLSIEVIYQREINVRQNRRNKIAKKIIEVVN